MLIERDAPVRRLTALAAEATGGAGGCVVIEGGAGIGKTALLDHLRSEAEGLGLQVLSATGADLERDHAFGVARQLLDPLWRSFDQDERAALLEGPAALARPLVDLVPTTANDHGRDGHDAAIETQSVLHGTSWLIGSLAERTPLLLVIDDAHWADEPSLDLLSYLARRVSDLPVLLAIARRPAAHGDAHVDPPGPLLHLEPLTATGIAALANDILGPGQEAGLVEACLAATGGNPLYVRALLDEVDRRRAHEVAHAAAVAAPPLATELESLGPEPVARSIDRRLAELPAGAIQTAEAVAILGDDATLVAVAELADLRPADAAASADALARAGILSSDGRLAFAHPVVRSTVTARLGVHEQGMRHAKAATQHAARGSAPEQTARHVLRAPTGLVDGAHRILTEAAEAAGRQGAPALASKLLARACEEPCSTDERFRALVALGDAEGRAALPGAVDTYAAAAAVCTDPELRAAVTVRRSLLLYRDGAGHRAVAELSRVLDDGGLSPETQLRTQAALLTIADIDRSLRPELAERLGPIVFDFAGRSGKPAALAMAHQAVEARLRYRDHHATGELTERALRACFATYAEPDARDVIPDPVHEDILSLMVLFLDTAERFDAVAELADGFLGHASRTGDAAAYAHVGVTYAWSCLRRGALDDAARILQAVRDQGSPKTVWMRAWISGISQAVASEFEPQVTPAYAATIADLEVGPKEMPPAERALIAVLRGKLRLAAGSIEDGLADLLQGGSALATVGTSGANYGWQSDAALALARLGRVEEARGHAAAELAANLEWGAPRAVGISRRAVALVETDDDVRIAGLGEAVEALEASEARLELARTLVALGAALRRRGRRADARAPLRRAAELAEACGAGTRVAAQAKVELAASGGRAPKSVEGGVGALTASERRIVELAMEGLSNPQVAQTLYISRRTVESHLASAYGKLGISGRRELGGVLAGSARS